MASESRKSIPSNANLNETISSAVEAIQSMPAVLNTLIKGINGIKDIDKGSLANLKKSTMGIKLYLNGLVDVITSLGGLEADGKLNAFLDKIKTEQDSNGNMVVDSKSELKIITAINGTNAVLSAVQKSIGSITNIDVSGRSLRKFQKNISKLPGIFSSMIDAITKGFQDLIDDPKIGKMFDLLTPDPERIEKYIYAAEQGKTAESHEETVKGKMGILDIMMRVFELTDKITAFRLSPVATFFIKTRLKQLGTVLSAMVGVLKTSMIDTVVKDADQWTKFDELFFGGRSGNGIVDMIESLTDENDGVFDRLKKFGIQMAIFGSLIISALERFGYGNEKKKGIIGALLDVIGDRRMTQFDGASDNFEGLSEVVESLNEIINGLLELSIKGFAVTKAGLRAIPNMFDALYSVIFGDGKHKGLTAFKKKADEINDYNDILSNIDSIIKNIIDASKSILILGLLAVPLMLASLLVIPAIWAFKHAVRSILKMVLEISDDHSNEIAIAAANIENIKLVVTSIIMTSGSIMLLALLALPLVAASVLATIAVAAVVGFIWVTAKLTKFVSNPANILQIILCVSAIQLVVAVIAMTLILVAASLLIVIQVSDTIRRNRKKIYSFLWMILGVIGVMILVGLLAATAVVVMGPGVVGLGLMSVALTLMTLMAAKLLLLCLISKNLEIGRVKAEIDKIVQCAQYIQVALFSNEKVVTDENGNQHVEKNKAGFIKSIFRGVGYIAEAICSSAFLTLTLISITMMILIAAELQALAKFGVRELDMNAVTESVNRVVNASYAVINATRGDPKKVDRLSSQDGLFGTVLRILLPENLMNVIDMMSSMALISMTFISIGIIRLTINSLMKLAEFGASEFNPEAVDTAIRRVIGAGYNIIDAVHDERHSRSNTSRGNGFLSKLLRWVLPDNLMDLIDAITSMGLIALTFVSIGMVKKIAENLMTITDAADKFNRESIESSTNTILGTANGLINLINGNEIDLSGANKARKKVEDVVTLSERVKELVKNTEAIGKTDAGSFDNVIAGYSKFIDKINGVNVENIKQTTSMFEQMARFSESIAGNFDGLADSLNEKIMPMIEELKNLLQQIPGQIEVSSTRTTNAIQNMQDTVSGKTPSRNEIAARVKAEQPNLTGAELQAETDKRIKAQVSNMSNSIVSKLDEIKRMFAEGTAKVATA